MRYSDVETFLVIAEQKSISKAANSLFVAQSTVSQRLSKLEREFGGRLFVRSPGIDGAVLTDKGERFLSIAERLLSIWRETDNIVKENSPVPLTVGSIESLATVTFNPLFDNILNACENLQFRLITGNSNSLHNMVDQRAIDVAFLAREVSNPHLFCYPILRERMCLLSKEGIIQSIQPIDVASLDIGKEVFFSWSPEFKVWHESLWKTGTRPSIYVDVTSLYLYFVSERQCWTVCPESMAKYLQNHVKANHTKMEIHEIKNPPPDRTVYLLMHSTPLAERDYALKLFNQELNRFLKDMKTDELESPI